MRKKLYILCLCLVCLCPFVTNRAANVVAGDERTDVYLPLLKGKRVAVFANHTAMVGGEHLVDLLLSEKIDVTAIFSPEHGFRGTASAGEKVSHSVDAKTGVPILSLYNGRDAALSARNMQRFDILLVDIQDVGLRFYTYHITLCHLMAACAEHNKPVVLLDRPNPNGHLVDGPILDMKYKSGVGMLPIPIVHGMTLGELARMANGKGWLPNKKRCDLTVVPCLDYTHSTLWEPPVPPSPNLPNLKAIYLYSSLCYFEATPVSVGRGTDLPFQIFGHPGLKSHAFRFTPQEREGAANPPQKGKLCYGTDLSQLPDSMARWKGVDLGYLIEAYRELHMGEKFFTSFFERLVGVDYVRTMIVQGCDAQEIRERWQDDVTRFKAERKPYLLYNE